MESILGLVNKTFSQKTKFAAKIILLLSLLISSSKIRSQTNNILVFVSHEETYYSEYVVMVEALVASGYTIDVRSATALPATSYMIPANTTIEETANTLSGSSYAEFTNQFQAMFGATWNAALNPTPATITVNGSILDVVDMSAYDAIAMPGGTGATAFRVDGNYSAMGAGARLVSAATVQQVAERLNTLAIQAVMAGKPILAQCHGASLPLFWRVPSTSGPGAESIGYSILKSGFATGFPEAATPTTMTSLDVTYKPNDRVTISSPHSSLTTSVEAQQKIITSRDWYPQTVAYATKALLNILQSYRSAYQLTENVSVLILHGGAIDLTNAPTSCQAVNWANNDVPCNFGAAPADLPADYTHLQTLLSANSPNDPYNFTVSQLNISGTLPYNANNQAEILAYLTNYDVVIFYKHWATNMNDALQHAIVAYADNGFGVLSLHHGLYNDFFFGSGKDILVNNLFGAQSHSSTWGNNRTNYNLVSTNYGHFVSTFGIDYADAIERPFVWSTNPPSSANYSHSYYSSIAVFEEIYTNMTFIAGQTFGTGVNQITALFSNDLNPSGQTHVSGFVKQFDGNLDGTVGRVAYFQPGETRASYAVNHRFGQVLRNAVAWAAPAVDPPITLPVEMIAFEAVSGEDEINLYWSTQSEVNNERFLIQKKSNDGRWEVIGQLKGNGTSNLRNDYHYLDSRPLQGSNYYRLKQLDFDGKYEYSEIVHAYFENHYSSLNIYPNPASFNLNVTSKYAEIKEITIMDINGRVVKKAAIFYDTIDISDLKSGVYYLKTESIEGYSFKLIVK